MKKKQMKHNHIYRGLLILAFLLSANGLRAQQDTVVKEKIVQLHYVNSNNNMQYLLIETILKAGKKKEPQINIPLQIFLDSNSASNLIGKFVTDGQGRAKAFIPVTLKTTWEASPKHKFIAVPDYVNKEEITPTELEITKSRITLDTTTADGVRKITVKVEVYENDKWTPLKDVEMKIGVERMGSILTAGEAETYTTDSTGAIAVDFNKDSLPGDLKGNILLIAKVDDNDQLGSLIVEKNVSWGIPTNPDNTFFDKRTLWTTRFRTPYWLLFMAYSIVIGVWGTLIYLITRLIKIKKIGSVNV